MKALIFILSLISISARSIDKPNEQLTIGQILLTQKITSMAESEKFSWFGTDQGVLRVNKKNNKTNWITTTNSILPSNNITSIACAPDGRTWIGTCRGILFWDNYGYIIIDSKNSNLPDDRITALAVDKSDYLWVGSHTGGVVKTKGFRFTNCDQENSVLNEDIISSITADANGDIWVGLFLKGLVKISPSDEWIFYPTGEKGLMSDNIRFVHLEKGGCYTIGTYEHGCYKLDGTQFHKITNETVDMKKIRSGFRNYQKNVTVYLCEEGSYICKNAVYFEKLANHCFSNASVRSTLECKCYNLYIEM